MRKHPLFFIGTAFLIGLVVLRLFTTLLRVLVGDGGEAAFVQAMTSSVQITESEAQRVWRFAREDIRRITRLMDQAERHGGVETLMKDGLARLAGPDMLAYWKLRAAWSTRDPALCAGSWTGNSDMQRISSVLVHASEAEIREGFRLTRVAVEAALAEAPRRWTPAEAEVIADQGWAALWELMTEDESDSVQQALEAGESVSPETRRAI